MIEAPTTPARSHWRVIAGRFLRHRPAMAALAFLAVVCAVALFAEQLAPYDYAHQDLARRRLGPRLEGWHLFGTDRLGRDYLSRVLYATRTSVSVAFLVGLLSTAIGTALGAAAGYCRGWVDAVVMRLTDFVIAVPFLAVLLVASAYLGHGSPVRVGVIISLLLWTTIARVVRGQSLVLREQPFVEAARAAGAGGTRIVLRHILPNTVGAVVVNATLLVALAILLEAALSFLGFGVDPPVPALGKLVEEGKGNMLTDWWLVVMPGLTIVGICLAINFVGDGLRDALDPTQHRRRPT